MKILILFLLLALSGLAEHKYMILTATSVKDSHYQLIQATGVYMTAANALYSCDGTQVILEYEEDVAQQCAPCMTAINNAIAAGVIPLTAAQARAFVKDENNGFTNCQE